MAQKPGNQGNRVQTWFSFIYDPPKCCHEISEYDNKNPKHIMKIQKNKKVKNMVFGHFWKLIFGFFDGECFLDFIIIFWNFMETFRGS